LLGTHLLESVKEFWICMAKQAAVILLVAVELVCGDN
jgi:hypothetical protein